MSIKSMNNLQGYFVADSLNKHLQELFIGCLVCKFDCFLNDKENRNTLQSTVFKVRPTNENPFSSIDSFLETIEKNVKDKVFAHTFVYTIDKIDYSASNIYYVTVLYKIDNEMHIIFE